MISLSTYLLGTKSCTNGPKVQSYVTFFFNVQVQMMYLPNLSCFSYTLSTMTSSTECSLITKFWCCFYLFCCSRKQDNRNIRESVSEFNRCCSLKPSATLSSYLFRGFLQIFRIIRNRIKKCQLI